MYEYFEEEKAKKKSMTAAEKKEAKAARDALEAPYTHCTLDGRKEKVGNFRVEPPGLFRGRGDHPKKGCLKVIAKLYDGRPVGAENIRCSSELSLRTSQSILAQRSPNQSPTFRVIGRRSLTTKLSPGSLTG